MRTRTTITLAALAVLALGGSALAYGHEEGWVQPPWSHHRAPILAALRTELLDDLLEKADADHDGKVTKAELDAFAADALKRFDKDGDGKLSPDEFQGLWLELSRPLEVRAFQFLDRNGEGEVTAQDLQRPLDRLFERLDRKGQGYVTEDELRAPLGGPGWRHVHNDGGSPGAEGSDRG